MVREIFLSKEILKVNDLFLYYIDINLNVKA